jgi:hypothetical protein
MTQLKQATISQRTLEAKRAEVDSQAVITQRGIEKASHDLHGIKFLAVGVSQQGGKFLLVGKDDRYVVLSVRNLARDPSAELERLEALDVHLLLPQTRYTFLGLAQKAAKMEPTFQVATQIGWFEDVYVLPDQVFPPQPPLQGFPPGCGRILVHLDAKDEEVHSRFRCSGSIKVSQEIFRLCRGNSRLIFAAALSFVGPCCQPFRLRAPGVQFVGNPETGKTVLGVVAGATYGGVPSSSLGFGSAWNGTPNGLEEYGPALHDTLMVLDETSLLPTDPKGRPLAFGEALMRLMQGQGKKRYGQSVDRWSVPFISTSNLSVYARLDPVRRKSYGAYTDRLADIPTPQGKASFFENLHGSPDEAAFGTKLFYLATTKYGYPIHVFLDRLTSALARDRAGLKAAVDADVAKYEAAASQIASSQRSVLRVRGHFATVYAVGCLAIRFKVLPFTEDELLDAVLSCHRDHVAFVDNEVTGGPEWSSLAVRAPEVVDPGSVRKPIASAVVPVPTPFDRLQHFIDRNIIPQRGKRGKLGMTLRNGQRTFVYIVERDGRTEYWFPNDLFEEIAGSARDALALKQELFARGLIETTRRGRGRNVSYEVKRLLPDGARPFFVVIRHTPQQPKAPSPALLMVAPV